MSDNVPCQRYINEGYFRVKEFTAETPYGHKVSTVTYVTGKGQLFITEKLRKEYSNSFIDFV